MPSPPAARGAVANRWGRGGQLDCRGSGGARCPPPGAFGEAVPPQSRGGSALLTPARGATSATGAGDLRSPTGGGSRTVPTGCREGRVAALAAACAAADGEAAGGRRPVAGVYVRGGADGRSRGGAGVMICHKPPYPALPPAIGGGWGQGRACLRQTPRTTSTAATSVGSCGGIFAHGVGQTSPPLASRASTNTPLESIHCVGPGRHMPLPRNPWRRGQGAREARRKMVAAAAAPPAAHPPRSLTR